MQPTTTPTATPATTISVDANQQRIWPTGASSRALHERPLREWPSELRPTERLYENGAAALSDAELLALILGTNGNLNPVALASELIAAFDGWRGLQSVSVEELAREPRMNRQRAARVKAALEIGRRLLLVGNPDRVQIKSPADAYTLLRDMEQFDQEHMRIVLLDTKNRLIRVHTLYIGCLNSANVRIGEVYKEAVRVNAAAIIIGHSHPSGDPSPSPEDISVNRQIVEAGKLLEIECLDHLVIGRGHYISMREQGLGFPT